MKRVVRLVLRPFYGLEGRLTPLYTPLSRSTFLLHAPDAAELLVRKAMLKLHIYPNRKATNHRSHRLLFAYSTSSHGANNALMHC